MCAENWSKCSTRRSNCWMRTKKHTSMKGTNVPKKMNIKMLGEKASSLALSQLIDSMAINQFKITRNRFSVHKSHLIQFCCCYTRISLQCCVCVPVLLLSLYSIYFFCCSQRLPSLSMNRETKCTIHTSFKRKRKGMEKKGHAQQLMMLSFMFLYFAPEVETYMDAKKNQKLPVCQLSNEKREQRKVFLLSAACWHKHPYARIPFGVNPVAEFVVY